MIERESRSRRPPETGGATTAMGRVLIGVLLIWLFLPTAGPAQLEVPFLSGRVSDSAGLLGPDSETRIEETLRALEEATGAQVAVLTIGSLEGENLEGYSLRVAETWQLGRGEIDDGALLLIVRDERKMRLEVGYGLAPTLTDVASSRILNDVLRPRFRQGDFEGGIEGAAVAIAGLLRGKEDALPAPSSSSSMGWRDRLLGGGIFLVVVGMFSLMALQSTGLVAWFLYVFLIPFWALFPYALSGSALGLVPVVIWLIAFPILRIVGLRSQTNQRGGWRRIFVPVGTGSWKSTRGWGGGGFSGGFSGGGGSFGGSGSSSSW